MTPTQPASSTQPRQPQRAPAARRSTLAGASAAAALALIVVALLLAAPAQASRDCGTYEGRGGPFRVVVVDGPVRCGKARRILRRYATSDKPCSGSGCYRTIRGWTCGSGNAGAFPRLFSCARGRRTIAAFSLAD